MSMSMHPWSIAIDAVNNDPPILTVDEAKGIILAHENVQRRSIQEISALLPELMQTGDLSERGFSKLRSVVQRVQMSDMPDLG